MGHEDSHSDALEAKEKGRLINHAECLSLCPHTSKAIRSIMKKKTQPTQANQFILANNQESQNLQKSLFRIPCQFGAIKKDYTICPASESSPSKIISLQIKYIFPNHHVFRII